MCASIRLKKGSGNGKVRVGALQSTNLSSLVLYSTCCEVDFQNKKLIIYKGGGSNGTKNLEILTQKNISQDLKRLFYITR